MTLKRAKEIRVFYDMFEDAEPDISTERLLQMTANAANIDVDDVVEALEVSGSAE